MFSPAPQSLSLGRWRASELGDDGRENEEMTKGTKRRWRVWGCGGYEQAWAEMTKGTRQRWRVRGSGGCEQAWAEMTKGSLVRWCRVGKDDALICGKFYEWDPVGCMGEIPTPVWVRHQHLYGWDTSTVMDEQTGRHWNGVALNIRAFHVHLSRLFILRETPEREKVLFQKWGQAFPCTNRRNYAAGHK